MYEPIIRVKYFNLKLRKTSLTHPIYGTVLLSKHSSLYYSSVENSFQSSLKIENVGMMRNACQRASDIYMCRVMAAILKIKIFQQVCFSDSQIYFWWHEELFSWLSSSLFISFRCCRAPLNNGSIFVDVNNYIRQRRKNSNGS